MSGAGEMLGLGKMSETQAKEAPNPNSKSRKPKAQDMVGHPFPPPKETDTDERNNNTNIFGNNEVAGTTSSGATPDNKTPHIFGSAPK